MSDEKKKKPLDVKQLTKDMQKRIVDARKEEEAAPKKFDVERGEYIEDVINDRHLED